MSKSYLFILILFVSQSLFAQKHNEIDSIKTELLKASKSEKIDLWNEIALLNIANTPDSMAKYARLALSESRKTGSQVQVIKSLHNYGHAKTLSEEFEISKEHLNEALELSIDLQDSLLLSKSYYLLGSYYYYTQEREASLNMFITSTSIIEKTGSHEEISKSYISIGVILSAMRRTKKAISYYRKALFSLDKKKDIQVTMRLYNNLMSSYNTEAGLENKQPFLDSSIYFGKKGLKMALQKKQQLGILRFSRILTSPLIRNGKYKEGLEMANLAYEKASIMNDTISMEVAKSNMGFAYLGLGKLSKARHIADSIIEFGRVFKVDAKRLKYMVEKKAGNFELALQIFEKYKFEKDNLYQDKDRKKILEIEQKFDTEKKQQEIKDLTTASQIQELKFSQQKLVYFLIIGAVIILALIMLFIFFNNKSKAKQASIDFEQKLLRNQLNPHFIFNALGAIQNFMLKNDAPNAGIYLSKFSKLMRQILEHSREEFISIDEEVEMLNNYLDIQKARFQESFNYSINIDSSIDTEVTTIPPMFAQPFLENAIEHGIANMEGRGNIEVNFSQSNDIIHLEITDNGKGITEASHENKKHKSLATVITKERMSLFGSKIRKNLSFAIENIKDSSGNVSGTRVRLDMPCLVMV